MILKGVRVFSKILLFFILTTITQIGGIVYLLIEVALKRTTPYYRLKKLVVFTLLYLFTSFVIVPYVASLFGREPILENHRVQAHSTFTKLCNRNYVRTEFQSTIQEIAEDFYKKHPGIQLVYLDANFPFINGYPLFPHLSHDDGKKLDISFIYQNTKDQVTNSKPTISGYGYFENPKPKEFDQTQYCKERGNTQYDLTRYLTFGTLDNNLKFAEEPTKDLLLSIIKHNTIEKVFIEPHLKKRLHLYDQKIRFHGCQAVRHDDHIHLQIR
ncbi:hypothetical protein [Aquimarina brevivitae]|uniref:Uncharacterized protein n=1 Tax=Aquimarina brevivitae TaxID=323412 RepID=A0A4Q7P2P2_9FLAO|nr:hypothetical protein [Aquimarina brevivitae]RZS93640.1 hypothetical protein EV197_2220 [Aquimarina brevivitae]